MLFRLRRKELPWEVVHSKFVDPVPIHYEHEDLDLLVVGDELACGTYTFDLKAPHAVKHFRNALLYARQRLLQYSAERGFNTLLLESWDLTLYRKGKQHRIEVKYSGYPALTKGLRTQAPPFMGILNCWDY